jgi:hypothetical protein
MITIRCKNCNIELTSHPTKTKCCGCENFTTIKDDTISALDLSKVIIVEQEKKEEEKASLFSEKELAFLENRKKRKVRKLDFEIR